MSTALIVAIVVAAVILIALVAFVLPRMRRTSQVRARERELEQRRDRVAGEHRAEAEERRREAESAEQRARIAEQEAKRERAEADLRDERARMHEEGRADHELIEDHERDRFAGTSAMRDEPAPLRDDRPMHEPTPDYQQGREDEAQLRESRFDRSTADEHSSTRRD